MADFLVARGLSSLAASATKSGMAIPAPIQELVERFKANRDALPKRLPRSRPGRSAGFGWLPASAENT